MSAITVDNISKKFRLPHHKKTTLFQHALGLMKRQMTYEEFWALRDISFEVEKGETLGIIGRNGSGKSTLLKILAKVLYPDSGTVQISGKIASFLELGVGFQPELTAAENIYIYASVLGISRRETGMVYDQILDFAELKRFEDMKLKNFSSGMYTRLAFSTAVNCNPDIMLVDEALAVGDTAFQKKCMAKIDEFKAQGKTIILVSHAMDTVRKICDRTVLLHNGVIVSLGDTDSVILDYASLSGSAGLKPEHIPLAVDWDGDGRQELCLFKHGLWFIDMDHDGEFDPRSDKKLGPFGVQPGDIPLAIDWDGDGRQDLAIYRQGKWYIDINRNGTFEPGEDLELGPFGGQPGDIPLAIDWDGDGRQEMAIYRPGGKWLIDLNRNGIFDPGEDLELGPFGVHPGDVPMAIGWDGDGRQDLAIFRKDTLYIDTNRDGLYREGTDLAPLGPSPLAEAGTPLAIDWQGNRRQDYCIFLDGNWYMDSERNGLFLEGGYIRFGPFFR